MLQESGVYIVITRGTPPNISLNAFDNNTTTVWHTQWKLAKPPHPHFLKVDMNVTNGMHGFYFTGSNNTAFFSVYIFEQPFAFGFLFART